MKVIDLRSVNEVAIDEEVRRLVAAAFPDGEVWVNRGCAEYCVVLRLPAIDLRNGAYRPRQPDSIATARRFAETAIVLLRAWRQRVTA